MNPALSLTHLRPNGTRLARRWLALGLFAALVIIPDGRAQSPGEPRGAVQGTVSNAVTGAPLSRA